MYVYTEHNTVAFKWPLDSDAVTLWWYASRCRGVRRGAPISCNKLDSMFLESLDISVSGVRRLLHRHTGRPTKVVRIQCSTSAANLLLSKKVVINGSSCRTERERRVRVIRCFNCQSLGHLAANCKNQKRCEVCSCTHVDDKLCSGDELCVNCGGSHRSSSSKCPVYITRYANLAGKYSESQYIATALTTLPPLSSNWHSTTPGGVAPKWEVGQHTRLCSAYEGAENGWRWRSRYNSA